MRTNRDRRYLVLLAGAFALAVAVEVLVPEPLSWQPSYEDDEAQPYGSLVLYDLLPALFPGARITPVDLPLYLVLRDTTLVGTDYLFVTDVFAPDALEASALLAHVARGNDVFVAARQVSGPLADTLRLETGYDPGTFPGVPAMLEADSVRVHFVNPALRTPEGFTYRRSAADAFVERFDTLRTTVLGRNDGGRPNFIRVAVGEGSLFVNTLPLAFTNYYLLHADHAGYVYRALSYLPVRDVLWDTYYKPLRTEAGTPLRYILRDPALRWAYGVLVALVLLFIAFEARRRQRIIPVVEPLRNTTLEFVKTVGRLYYRHGNHANLAEKRVAYFLDYLRTVLRLPTDVLGEDLVQRTAERSGVPADDVRAVFACLARVRGRPVLREAELVELSGLIEDFHRKTTR
jgi:hypothetical protein